MKTSQVQELRHGLYRVHWKEGGSSLAAVGSLPNGDRWIAPCNWINSPPSNKWSGENVWKAVEYVEVIREDR
jgi:hypothetical protein